MCKKDYQPFFVNRAFKRLLYKELKELLSNNNLTESKTKATIIETTNTATQNTATSNTATSNTTTSNTTTSNTTRLNNTRSNNVQSNNVQSNKETKTTNEIKIEENLSNKSQVNAFCKLYKLYLESKKKKKEDSLIKFVVVFICLLILGLAIIDLLKNKSCKYFTYLFMK